MGETGAEQPKIGFTQRVKEAFVPKMAKEKWLREQSGQIKQFMEVNKHMNDEQRAQVVTDIEAKATKAANIEVGKHWLAVAAGTATLVGAGALVANPEWADALTKGIPLGKAEGARRISLGKPAEWLSSGAHTAHDFLDRMYGSALRLKNKIIKPKVVLA